MAPRLSLHSLLKEITSNVYFQPPENVQMAYPAIVYSRDGSTAERADNESYRLTKRYQVTVIDRNPDSDLPDQVEGLSMCTMNRWFASDNLNHWVFTIFF